MLLSKALVCLFLVPDQHGSTSENQMNFRHLMFIGHFEEHLWMYSCRCNITLNQVLSK